MNSIVSIRKSTILSDIKQSDRPGLAMVGAANDGYYDSRGEPRMFAGPPVFYVAGTIIQSALSYMLFAGKVIFKTKHPIWGTFFAIGAIYNAIGISESYKNSK